ncbi:MAG: alginate lyase family protein [Gemmatimonadota bacterium]
MRAMQLAAKLRGRSSAELRERVGQRVAQWIERAGWRDRGEASDTAFSRRLHPELQDRALVQLTRAVRHGPRPPFFPGVDELPGTLALLRERWPARVADVTRAADDIVAGRFALLGHAPLRIADPVDWSRDYLRNVSAPDLHWSRIDYLDPAVAGDHKLVWELNRHQFLVTLGMAFALTGREAYATRAAQLLTDWLDANPPKQGVNWASSLEVAYRAIAWLWAMRLLSRAPSFASPLLLRWLKAMEVSGRHLERYLSTWFSPNTHLTGEALGLLYLGTQLPELSASARWRDRGWAILREQLPRHVRADGSYFEQATYYHRYTLDIYLHARVLAVAHGLPGTGGVDDALVRLAGFLAWSTRADGTIPLFGDEDGGRLLFLDARPGDDARSPVAAVAALAGDAELAYAAGAPTDEVAWLLGRAGVARLDEIHAHPPAESARAFRDGGFFVMRDGWEHDASVMTIDCGPLGAASGGHAHADTLAFDLAIGDCPVFVDAGTVSYTTSPAERDLMRSSQVHNTVSLDGRSSSESAGPFRWAQMTGGVLDAWHTSPAGALFEGHHDGYLRLPSPARHRRLILAARGGWWLVRDVIEGEGGEDHEATATFQAAAGLDLAVTGDTLRVSDDGRRVATVRALGAGGRWVVDDGVASRRYGARDTARRARFVFPALGSGRTAVTFAITRGAGIPWRLAHDRSDGRDVVRLGAGAVEDVVIFDAQEVVDGVRTDARVAWVRRRASDGVVESLFTIGGTMVELDGARLADPEGGVVSAVRERDGWRVARSDARPGPPPVRGTKP